MKKDRFDIGIYCLQKYARTKQHIKELAECGINLVVGLEYDRPALDLLETYGIEVMISDAVPSWFGGKGDNAGTMAAQNPLKSYEERAKEFKDHPAIRGIDIGDEPSCLDFPHYGRVYEKVKQLFPGKEPYLNLYPGYGMVYQENGKNVVGELGTSDYGEYIDQYCKYFPADYLGFDFYPYSARISLFYENMAVAARACRNTGRSMRMVLQVNSSRPEEWISENQLRFQAYTALCFGVDMILWACYTAGWWYNQVLDENGEKTEQYRKLKKVNEEVQRIAGEYMKYTSLATHFVGFEGTDWLKDVTQEGVSCLNTEIFTEISGEDESPLVVGEMKAGDGSGSGALMICAADDPYDKNPKKVKIRFCCAGRNIKALGGEGYIPVQELGKGRYAVEVSSCFGVLITAE